MSVDADTEDKDKREEGGLKETAKVLVHALILAMIVRYFLFQPFNIPSGSMEHSLLVGDYLFVSKYSYGYSKYSLPGSPDLFDGRILEGKPKRGDVAVFRLPRNTDTDYIKRVIGIPGDEVQMVNGQVFLNGKPIPKTYVDEVNYTTQGGVPVVARRYREQLPNGKSYHVLDLGEGSLDNTGVFTVPEGHYFMLGDNRDNSVDSRVQSGAGRVGFVPLQNFIGKAQIIFFSADDRMSFWKVWEWPSLVRWGRLFKLID